LAKIDIRSQYRQIHFNGGTVKSCGFAGAHNQEIFGKCTQGITPNGSIETRGESRYGNEA